MKSEKKFYPMIFGILTLSVVFLSVGMGSSIFSFSKSFGILSPWVFSWSFSMDPVSSLFLLMVCCVSTSVFLYSWGYLQGEAMWNKFIQTLLLFALSMMILSLSSSVISTMVGWDGLGLSSVGLIFFYFGWVSFRNGMVTFFCNRVGDVFFMIFICLLSMTPCNLTMAHMIVLLVSGITKSAQIPFHIWLPMAMAAPTPVSSLVHSSTLVTGGVFILVRYGSEIVNFHDTALVLFCLSSLTLFFSGASSVFEMDLKKVIALSTLVHVSLIMIYISLGDFVPALTHLLCHAFMKSGLFMIGGLVIHKAGGSQDVRLMTLYPPSSPSSMVLLSVFLLSMVGFPFLSGFVSKELMLGSLIEGFGFNVSVVSIYFGLFSSGAYSFRLFFHLIRNHPVPFESSSWSSDVPMLLPLILSSLGSLILGAGLYIFLPSIEAIEESVFLFQVEKILVMVTFVSSVFLILALGNSTLGFKIFATLSKMGLVSSSLGEVSKSVLIFSKNVQFLDKEGVVGSSVKTLSLFTQSLVKTPLPFTEGSKSQLLKLGLICVLIFVTSSM
uniref:NADH-ubiquinone oxidoreductase chain 5 n=1 Tax=Bovicola bovis TaxID=160097 RepID=A0A386B2C7_9NEOP|nr:NADH dehydrogenase subunit 5 [Bovicola bovis]